MIQPISSAEYRMMQAKAMPEKVLQEKVRRLCRELGWMHYHTHRSQHSEKGFPDSFMMRSRDSRILVRELKRQDKDPTPKQLEWLEGMNAAGLDVGVWRPLDYFNGTILRDLTRE